MPTVFQNSGYRFFFFSLDRGEPVHIHVAKQNGYAKFWLKDILLAKSRNFNSAELSEIRKLIMENGDNIRRKWNEHFNH